MFDGDEDAGLVLAGPGVVISVAHILCNRCSQATYDQDSSSSMRLLAWLFTSRVSTSAR